MTAAAYYKSNGKRLCATETSPSDVIETLEAIEEYFDQRADADLDASGYTPNDEMRHLIAVRAALSTLKVQAPPPAEILVGTWLPIERADKTITNVEDFSEVGVIIQTSDRYWVRDDDGRVYEAAWSVGNNGDRDYWWDFEGESPVDPIEFMPHPLDPRFASPEGSADGR